MRLVGATSSARNCDSSGEDLVSDNVAGESDGPSDGLLNLSTSVPSVLLSPTMDTPVHLLKEAMNSFRSTPNSHKDALLVGRSL